MVQYTKFVQVGRVARVEEGKYTGLLVVIVNPISNKWVLVDGTFNGVPRQKLNVREIRLTKFVVDIEYKATSSEVSEAAGKFDLLKKWSETNWAKRECAKKVRAGLNDFERFQLSALRRKRSKLIQKQLAVKH